MDRERKKDERETSQKNERWRKKTKKRRNIETQENA